MAMSKFSKSAADLPPSVRKNSQIPFVPEVKKMDMVDGHDADKSEWIKLEFLMDPENHFEAPRTIFKDGCRVPEEWIKWVMAFRKIENLITMKEPAGKTRMFRTLLKGQALSSFENNLMEVGGRKLRCP
jgi:hypothetical protein